jgi:hypothetical protein
LEAEAFAFDCPRKNGAEKGEIFMSYLLSDDHRLRRRRRGAASSAEQQRLEVHRSFRSYTALLVEGSLVSTMYERGNGKGKKAKA